MNSLQDFVRTQQVALEVVRTAGTDCTVYDLWVGEYGGEDKLQCIQDLDGVFPPGSNVQEYAQMLQSHMTELLSEGCSEELLLATYDFVDRLAEMIVAEMGCRDEPQPHESVYPAEVPAGTSRYALVA